MAKTAFVLGAGASSDEGLPEQNKLLKTYFESPDTDSFRDTLAAYFRNFFGVNLDDLDKAVFPTFEEALGILELAIERDESFGPNYTLDKIREARRDLVLSMGVAIERAPLNGKDTHNKLLSRLFPDMQLTPDQYSFISFNYDILLDRAIMNLLDKDIYVDYRITFTNQEKEFPGFPNWTSPGEKCVTYLKPHGSLNWVYCPTCNSIYMLGSSKSGVFTTGYIHKLEHCPKDETVLDCLIEPPSFFKTYKNIYLSIVWKEMRDLLAEVDRIVFIGYSWPDADIWTKYLIKRTRHRKTTEFIVVNPSEEEVSKYRRFWVPSNTTRSRLGSSLRM